MPDLFFLGEITTIAVLLAFFWYQLEKLHRKLPFS